MAHFIVAGLFVQNVMIHLIGPPGVGKYTIGSLVAERIGARLVDNHSVNNVIFNLVAPDGIRPLPSAIWPRVAQVRAAVLDTMIHVSPPGLSFVLTNYIRGEDPGEEAAFLQVVDVAAARGATFVPVLLSCETPVLVQRVVSEDRARRMKLIDPVRTASLNDDVPAFRTDHPNTLELDVTHVSPDEAASRIIEWTQACHAKAS